MHVLLTVLGEFRIGDMIIQLIFLFIPVAIIVGISMFFMSRKRNDRLDRIENKLDQLLSEKTDKKL